MEKRLYTTLVLSLFMLIVAAQGFKNPVLSGFYPDPSVCRVGEDYYLVNSSFHYFPGVPIHHSKDLIHWKQIGYCLSRPSQAKLKKIGFWNGIYAPTIRHHEGIFYMVTTNTSDKGNFYVYTDNPAGEWSEPVWVKQPGIDPDLFFDDDGKCYFMSARGGGCMQLSEIDIKTGKLLSEPKNIWSGTGGRCAEAPHLYKKDGYYYLMIAEGGTEYGHKVTIARSRSIFGPYESNPANPILTHINATGMGNPIQGTGHADLIQAHDGSWWTVFLGFRPQSHTHHVLGRETFLAPVRWDKDSWPIINDNGTVSLKMNCHTLPQFVFPFEPLRNDFTDAKLGFEWNYLCIPHANNYSLTERKGFLRLKATTLTINHIDSPTFVGRRQQHIDFRATALLDFQGIKDGAEAGITTYMANDYHYDLSVLCKEGRHYLSLSYRLSRLHHQEKEIALEGKQVFLRVEGSKDCYTYFYSTNDKQYEKLSEINTRFLSSETAGGFTGVYLGLFAQEKLATGSYADFDWFEYTALDNKCTKK
jgi:xylan 1,4-beta-xylosidase